MPPPPPDSACDSRLSSRESLALLSLDRRSSNLSSTVAAGEPATGPALVALVDRIALLSSTSSARFIDAFRCAIALASSEAIEDEDAEDNTSDLRLRLTLLVRDVGF